MSDTDRQRIVALLREHEVCCVRSGHAEALAEALAEAIVAELGGDVCEEHEETIGELQKENAGLRCRRMEFWAGSHSVEIGRRDGYGRRHVRVNTEDGPFTGWIEPAGDQ